MTECEATLERSISWEKLQGSVTALKEKEKEKQTKKAFRGKWIIIIILLVVKWTNLAIFIPRDPKVCCQIVCTEIPCHFSGTPPPVGEGHMEKNVLENRDCRDKLRHME